MNGPSDMYRDMFEPGWHEREKLHRDKFLDAIPVIGNPTSQAADGMKVVAWLSKHGHMQGNHDGLSAYHAYQYTKSHDWQALTPLASAQAAVAAERNQRIVADSYRSRCDALEAALKQAMDGLWHGIRLLHVAEMTTELDRLHAAISTINTTLGEHPGSVGVTKG